MNDTAGLHQSTFSPHRQTKFITHGWKSSAMSAGLVNMMKGSKILTDDASEKVYVSRFVLPAQRI